MSAFFGFLVVAAMICTLVVLVTGVISFAVHGEFYKKNANKLMRLRVLFQGLALVLFAFLLFVVMGR